jgi:hypothetical protein
MSSEGGYTNLPNSFIEDDNLTGAEKLVMLSLYRFYNTEQQRAWPSIAKIAACARMTPRWAIETLKALEQKGYIRAEKGAGKTTRYELITHELSSPVNTVHPCTDFTSPVNSVHIDPCTDFTSPVNSVHPTNTNTNTNTQLLETNTKNAPAKKDDFAADFEEFWRAYPKPKNPDKTPTRKRYEALRKKGVSGEDLLKAAQGYARSTQGTDPRYIKHGATFLGPQEPWRDYLTEPEPVSDEPPDAEKLFPDLAEWLKQNRSEANER